MAITEAQEIDLIEIVGADRALQIRTATVIRRDGVELSRSFHRKVMEADADFSLEGDEIRALHGAVHSQKVKARVAARNRSAAKI